MKPVGQRGQWLQASILERIQPMSEIKLMDPYFNKEDQTREPATYKNCMQC